MQQLAKIEFVDCDLNRERERRVEVVCYAVRNRSLSDFGTKQRGPCIRGFLGIQTLLLPRNNEE